MGIEDVRTAPRAPWQNAFVEQLSLKIPLPVSECFDHVIVFNEAGLQRLMALYCSVLPNGPARTCRSTKTRRFRVRSRGPSDGIVVAIPEVGGLHHRYERRAA